VQIPANDAARARTEELIQAEQERVTVWLAARVDVSAIPHHVRLPVRRGSPDLTGALQEYLDRAGAADIEAALPPSLGTDRQDPV
jgi:hypothetical protein